jgi:hypothetical protein
MLQKHYASYMIFCLVYENAQNLLLAAAECLVTTNNILQNAVILFNVFGLLKMKRGLAQKMPD